MKKRMMILMVGTTFLLQGCQVNKESFGTLLGAAGGAAVGHAACGNSKNQGLCVLAGAAIGGLIGNRIGKSLDEADKKRLAEETTMVLAANTPESSTRTWRNPDTGVRGKVSVVKETSATQTSSMTVMKDRLQQTPPIDLIGETYTVTANRLTVRGGPGREFKELPPGLVKAQMVHVLGSVIDDKDWYLISENGAASGYVSAKYMTPAGFVVTQEMKPSTGTTEQVTVQTNRKCKTVRQEVTLADNSAESDEVTLCQSPDGTWDLV
tara:strand:+ start:5093 stop:5890 length:798 start_codon:yes stop_codon:yes gene_type:complete